MIPPLNPKRIGFGELRIAELMEVPCDVLRKAMEALFPLCTPYPMYQFNQVVICILYL
jgi:hypothetical protein